MNVMSTAVFKTLDDAKTFRTELYANSGVQSVLKWGAKEKRFFVVSMWPTDQDEKMVKSALYILDNTMNVFTASPQDVMLIEL